MKDRGLAKQARQIARAVHTRTTAIATAPAPIADKCDFRVIKAAVAGQFAAMQKQPLFRVELDGDTLWAAYLAAFPPSSNPVFRERTEHDCSCCRHFIRTLGNVVAVGDDGRLVSIWDIEMADPVYAAVATVLSVLVRNARIAGPFAHYEPSAGTHQSFEMDINSVSENAPVRTWDHFFVNIDRRHVRAKDTIPTWLSEQRSRHDVFLRSLREIGADAAETVLDLIAQGSLYRGEEHRHSVARFRDLKARFAALGDDSAAQDVFAWTADVSVLAAVSHIRNTAIGTFLVDLSEGRELEAAVASFEAKVAPMNYKRPSALVTPAMVAKAKETHAGLGLLSALDRRFATARDVGVHDVLFADRSPRVIAADVFDDVAQEVGARAGKANFDKVEDVPVERFLSEIVPHASSIEVLLENRHAGNLVSLIAPSDPTAGRIFKWGNGFSWSYAGELADAIRERVKKAGGNVEGDLCCRLAWSNFDDLDFHMIEPCGHEISFRSRYCTSPSGGRLDVDMNAFEVVGAKMKPADAGEQLSGLGFSSTRRDSVTCRVRGSFTRTIKVTF